MIVWLKQLRDRVIDSDSDHLIWCSKLRLILYEIENLKDHHNHQMYTVVRRELEDHIAYGLHRGFIPHNLPKSNKKLLKIK